MTNPKVDLADDNAGRPPEVLRSGSPRMADATGVAVVFSVR